MKSIGIWTGIFLLFAVAVWSMIAMVNRDSQMKEITPPEVTQKDQVLGARDSKVVLIKYSDFQCPACKYYASLVKELKYEFGDQLLVVYRFFPLPGHQNAMRASQAAYAAGLQGKFWEMSDLLYDNQELWSSSSKAKDVFKEYAKQLSLDLDQFDSDYEAESTNKLINEQLESGVKIGITYTPSFFINGKLIQNPQGYDAFKSLIQDELKK